MLHEMSRTSTCSILYLMRMSLIAVSLLFVFKTVTFVIFVKNICIFCNVFLFSKKKALVHGINHPQTKALISMRISELDSNHGKLQTLIYWQLRSRSDFEYLRPSGWLPIRPHSLSLNVTCLFLHFQ